ncbi:hypothetical protein [Sanyastnella coralliicola]|uniref:hypothetical protein n=1 Tax=Sanyastnella coralliicola TaxID=3069118 RepID=UPI0027BA6C9D|nr:hypothetical protein [Longitalea sp. SCSIO 12813]
MYIDLIGREPLDVEMDNHVAYLEENGLSASARGVIADELMFSTAYVEGDSTYNHAHFYRLYELAKARFIEGASEAVLQEDWAVLNSNAVNDSLNGNIAGYQFNRAQANKILDILNSREQLRTEAITIDEMMRRMMFNSIYDDINMNSFNFVNATFDDLYYRFPTQDEFDNAYQIIEFNEPAIIFGQVASNKPEYLDALTATSEFHEGMIYWAYQSLLARDPSSQEVFELIGNFQNTMNYQAVLKTVLITDEYAGFD